MLASLRWAGLLSPASRAVAGISIFSGEHLALLLAVADVIVPRDGESPAASDTDLVPVLERWVTSRRERAHLYENGLAALESAVAEAVPHDAGRPRAAELAALCERWDRDYRAGGATPAARFFEQLRRDVLRVYYSSPAGWSSATAGA